MTIKSDPGAQRPPLGAEQISFLPKPCPCGELPIEKEGLVLNWCRCRELVVFETVAEWNDWTGSRPLED